MGRGSHYDCDPPSYARAVLLCLSAGFELRNRTVDVLRETLEVELNGPLTRVVSWLLPDLVAHALMPVMPTYVFTLEQGRTKWTTSLMLGYRPDARLLRNHDVSPRCRWILSRRKAQRPWPARQ